ncbi:MAG: cadherin-like domain-containing protein [Chloroflexota bacterium]
MSKRFGPYLIKGIIATTAQATLYLAEYLPTGELGILKVYHPKLTADPAAREQLLNHLKKLRDLPRHVGILPILEVGEASFAHEPDIIYVYVTTPYCPQGDLRHYLNEQQQQQKPLPLPLILRWVAELADALAHAHAHGLRHGDVKTENVLLCPTSDPDYPHQMKLTDFALMRGTGAQPIGSFPYMSPEQVRKESLDGRSDIYALGVLLYLLLAGHFPFDIKKPADVAQHLYAPFEPPRTAPPNVQAIVARAMSRDVNGRYPTASAMATDLRQAIATLHPATPPVPPPAAELPLVPTELRGLDKIAHINVGERLEKHLTWENPSEYRLIVSHQYEGDRLYYLRQGYVRLGRDPKQNDIVLPDVRVSRQHAILERIPRRQWQILSLKGANKLFLEGKDRSDQTEPIAWDKEETLRIGPYFLRWQDVTLVNGPVDEELDDLAVAPPPGDVALTVTVEPEGEIIFVQADQTVPLLITLHNRSETTNHYQLEFVGPEQVPLRWQNPAQPLQLNANETGTQEIRLSTFPNSAATAGRYPCHLRIYQVNTRTLLQEYPLVIEIPPFDQLAVDMHPSRIRHGDATQIRLENRGNTPQTYRLLARDQADELLFFPFPDRQVVVPNGGAVVERLEVKAKKRPWVGRTKTIQFSLEATPLGQINSVTPKTGELILSPRIPGWFVTFFILAALVLAALGFFIFGEIQANAQEQITTATNLQATAEAKVNQAAIDLEQADGRVNGAISEADRISAEGTRSVLQVTATVAAAVATQTAVASQATLDAQDNVPPNNPPTGITLDKTDVAENKPPVTLIGTLTTQDADAQDTHAYSLSCEQTPDDNNAFVTRNNQLLTGEEFDFETQNSYTICIQSNDRKGGTFEQLFTIDVLDTNDEPTGLTLSPAEVQENVPVGASVGTFTTADPDKGDNHKYSLVAGSGSGDNASFVIDGATLKINVSPNFESTKKQYSVLVRSEDQAGEKIEQKFTIKVVDVNEPGTAVMLSASEVEENKPDGTEVGTISVTGDPDATSNYTLQLTSGGGSFQITTESKLVTKVALDHETTPTIAIKIQATDSTDPEIKLEQEFTITINDINEAPTAIFLEPSSVEEGKVSVSVGTLSAADPDPGDLHTFTLVEGDGDADNDKFRIVNRNQLHTDEELDYDTQITYSILVQVSDHTDPSKAKTFKQPLTVTSENVEEPPNVITNTGELIHVSQADLADPNFSFPDIQITRSALEATDPEGATVTYTIVNGEEPSHGFLSLNDSTPVTTFTQENINNGNLKYIRNIPSTLHTSDNDTFTFTVSDGTLVSEPHTFYITINARPVVEENILVRAPSITPSSEPIEVKSDDLSTSDEDENSSDESDKDEIVYTLQARSAVEPDPAPPHGMLCLVTNPDSDPPSCPPLNNDSTFTQDDIENGRLHYTPNDSNPNNLDDYFLFTVQDKYQAFAGGDTDALKQYRFTIIIGPPDVVMRTSLSVAVNQNGTITSDNLETSVSANRAENVTFTIKALPASGILKLNGEILNTTNRKTFTQKDILEEKLVYTAPATVPDPQPSLQFTVEINGVSFTEIYTLGFTVTPVQGASSTWVTEQIKQGGSPVLTVYSVIRLVY